MSDVANLLERARMKGLHFATAESCTGGKIAAELTEIAGSSSVVLCGFITYSNAAKMRMLGVLPATLDAHGAVSQEVAREMAEGALAHSEADIAVSVTGIAGPGGSEHKPEGRVCFGLASKTHPTHVETQEFGPLGRAEVRRVSTLRGLALLSEAVDRA